MQALVTGTSSGIGEAVAKRLLSEGHSVIGISRGISGIQHLNFQNEELDLTDLATLENRLPSLAKQYANVSSLVLCAGFGRFGNLEEFSYAQIRELIDVNLIANLYIARAYLPALKARQAGTLVFVGSESALSGGRRGVAYVAAKAGLAGAVSALRQECAPSGVKVGIVVPGMVKTNFYNNSEFTHGASPENYIEPEDIADAVMLILNSRQGSVVDTVHVSPLKSVIRRR